MKNKPGPVMRSWVLSVEKDMVLKKVTPAHSNYKQNKDYDIEKGENRGGKGEE